MSYALRSYRGPSSFVAGFSGFGAAASANVSVTVPPGTATKLASEALSMIGANPKVVGQLSQIGSTFYAVGNTAYETASIIAGAGDLSVTQMIMLPMDVLAKIGSTLVSVFPDIVDDVATALGTTAKAIGAVGNAIPLIGALLGFVSIGIENIISSQKVASVAAQQACQQWYRPPGPASRAEAYGGKVPSDFLVAVGGKTLSSVGEVFKEVGESTCRLYSVYNSRTVFCDAAVVQPLVQTGFAKLLGPPGIPADVRAILRKLREAIVAARSDPTSDGGISLWPIYLDLIHSQFKNGNMTWELANHIYDCDVLPPYAEGGSMSSGPQSAPRGSQAAKTHHCTYIQNSKCYVEERCKCRSHEKRAWQEFQAAIEDWSLTINPFYTMDQVKAGQLKQTLNVTLASIKADAKKPPSAAALASKFTLSATAAKKDMAKRMSAAKVSLKLSAAELASKMNPIAAILLGGGLVAAGLVAWDVWRRRRR